MAKVAPAPLKHVHARTLASSVQPWHESVNEPSGTPTAFGGSASLHLSDPASLVTVAPSLHELVWSTLSTRAPHGFAQCVHVRTLSDSEKLQPEQVPL